MRRTAWRSTTVPSRPSPIVRRAGRSSAPCAPRSVASLGLDPRAFSCLLDSAGAGLRPGDGIAGGLVRIRGLPRYRDRGRTPGNDEGGSMEDAAALASDRELPTGDRDVPAGERDEELALAARSDPAAFGLLYARHRLAVFRYLRTRTSSADDAAELTAVAFERALTAMPRYRPTGGGILAWLLRIARNAAIDAG